MKNISTIGLDLAKHVFQVHGRTAPALSVLRRNPKRGQVLSFFLTLPPCTVAMEACAGAHHWAREIARWSSGSVDCSGLREALREAPEERRCRRGGNLRSGPAPDHALRRCQERRDTGCGHRLSHARHLRRQNQAERGTLLGMSRDEEVQAGFLAFGNCLRAWLNHRGLPTAYRGLPTAYIYCHEHGKKLCLHPHLGSICPWFARSAMSSDPGHEDGRRARSVLQRPTRRVSGPKREAHWLHWLLMSYLVKGYGPRIVVQSEGNSPDGRPVMLGSTSARQAMK